MKTKLNLTQLREAIAERSAKGHKAYEEAGPERDFTKVKVFGEGLKTTDVVEKLKQLNAELSDYHADFQELTAIENEAKRMADIDAEFNLPDKSMIHPEKGAGDARAERKTIGQLIMSSGVHINKGKPVFLPDVDLKADFFLGTPGWPAESLRIGRVELFPTRPIAVTDRIPTLPTTQNLVKYMKETTFTNTAAEKAEGAAGVEATLVLGESSDEVEKLTVYIPVSEEQLEDVPAAEGYLTNRLSFMVRQRLDGQVLEGNGATPNLLGTLSLNGLQSQALGTDTAPDCLYKALDLIRTAGFTEPSDLFINPSDWQPIRLLRTADGIYIFGGPESPGPSSIWGVPVTKTTAVTANTAICGDYANFSTLFIRKGIEVEMSNGYSDFFIKGKFAVKATMRCAMVHFRIPAFAKITGL